VHELNLTLTMQLGPRTVYVYSEPMTSYALGGLVGSRQTLQHQRADVMAAMLKIMKSLVTKKPTASVDAYLLKEQLCQISPRSDLKWQDLKEVAQQQQQQQQDD